MINTKQDYESPTTKVLELRISRIVCTSTTNESMENTDMLGNWSII